MKWTEEEENALLGYLRDENNNKRFLKRNVERDEAFKDCATFLSKQSGRNRKFTGKDVKKFCIYLVEERYRLDHSNLSHLFRIGLFEKSDGKPCDIFTREECRRFEQEDEARREGLPIPKEKTALPLRISESLDSFEGQRGRGRPRSFEVDDAKRSSEHARKRQKAGHPTSLNDSQPPSVAEERKSSIGFPAELSHLVYHHRHLDGANIHQKFAQLEKNIMIAADSLSSTLQVKSSVNCTDRYGPDDYLLIKSIPIATIIHCWHSGAHFQIARALIGRAVFQWVFGNEITDSEVYGYPSKEVVESVWGFKCKHYGMEMLKPFYAILKDAYFWHTTETKFLNVLLPRRSRELSGHLATVLGHLFRTSVPYCSVAHDGEQARRKDCTSWSCQLEAIFFDALDLCVRLRQRNHNTVFRWPAINDRYDHTTMQNEGENVADEQSNPLVKVTYMPTVLDQSNSEEPGAVDAGVWYKAVVRLADAAGMGQMEMSTAADVEPESGFSAD